MSSFFPFSSATWIVLSVLLFFVLLFIHGNNSKVNPIHWEHLIIDAQNNRTSPYKMGYLIGLIVGTWVIITLADGEGLTYDIFAVYLIYLLGGAGWNSFLKSRSHTSPPPAPPDMSDPKHD